MERQATVKIAGTEYEIDPKSYQEWVEADVVGARRFNEIVGSSRPGLEPRAEIRTWRIDDWSAGEGHKFLDSTPGHRSQRGFQLSTDGLDVTTPGQVLLGRAVVNSDTTAADVADGPHLAIGNGHVWRAFATDTLTTSTAEQTALDTWTTRTDGFSGVPDQALRGPITGWHGGIFEGGTQIGAVGGLRRVTPAGNTQWVAEVSRAPHAADNRVYYGAFGTTSSTLRRVGLDAAGAATTMTTFNGVGSSFSTSVPLQQVSVGARIYTLIASTTEFMRLWVLETDIGREVAIFEGLYPEITFDQGLMAVVNGIVFVGGYESKDDGTEVPRVDYYDGERPGIAFRLSERTSSTARVTALARGRADELLVGVRRSTGTQEVYKYSLDTGGVTLLATFSSTGEYITSLAYLAGVVYIATTASGAIVKRTKTSGSGTMPSSSTITEPIWDFDLPDTEKLLTEIEVQTETLPSGASVEVQVILDGTTSVTTDSAGAAIAHSSGTRTLFTISDFDTERTFRFIQPKVVLKTSDTANTPILYSVTIRCLPLATKLRYFEFEVLCYDETASNRLMNRQRTGDDIAADLMSLRDSTSDRVFQFQPLIKDSPGPHPGPTETTYNVMFAPGEQNGHYRSIAAGEGRILMRLLKVG